MHSLKAPLKFLSLLVNITQYCIQTFFALCCFSKFVCSMCITVVRRRWSYLNSSKYLNINSMPLRMYMCLFKRFFFLKYSLTILISFFMKHARNKYRKNIFRRLYRLSSTKTCLLAAVTWLFFSSPDFCLIDKCQDFGLETKFWKDTSLQISGSNTYILSQARWEFTSVLIQRCNLQNRVLLLQILIENKNKLFWHKLTRHF